MYVYTVTIKPTTFVDQFDNKTYGFRMSDMGHSFYSQTYCDTWTFMPKSDLDVLERAIYCGDEIAQDMFVTIHGRRGGLFIDPTWYSWDKIKHLFVDFEDQNPVGKS